MVFKCQEDSFLRQFTTTVVSCEEAKLKLPSSGDADPVELEGFNVICEDTILFPEGGGQPCDYGTINGFPVRSVIRKGKEAVHFVETFKALEVGTEVLQIVNWERRLDHMQQHSGQHLITELFDKEFNYDTTSWWLGSETSYIELNTKHVITRESLDVIENMANDIIREGRPVSVALIDEKALHQMQGLRAPRGLPKDVEGPVRVIRIEGQRDNMCCGTHVNNLSQLQCVKLLYEEKNKNSVYVHFVVGQRVPKTLGKCFAREQQVTLALKGGPLQHVELIQKLQNNLKATKKSFQKLLRDLAIMEAEKLESLPKPLPKYYSLHKKDGIEPDFINTFLRNVSVDGISLFFLTVSEPSVGRQPGKGHMILKGDPELVEEFGPKFMEILDGKGNGKEGMFQGKINDSDKIRLCETLLENHFNPPPTNTEVKKEPAQGS
ncbi:alanyl-tRNA editing protein Aarsd1-A-like [Musca vetustissima]|uniref:alanyl-tRNA editing protein Aarsd1-A-like n=1 Tax=Musca vetustissima TaxID=27455 RepID=UPI002AB70072|nr:alanyl-tRNA editing protein Aarsd1-A-like [Musca vetustissima]